MTGIILMLSGSILFLVGLYFYNSPIKPENQPASRPETIAAESVLTKSESVIERKNADAKLLTYEKRLTDFEQKQKIRIIKSVSNSTDQNEKNGYDFEKFIVQKFNPNYFKIKEWAGDKYVNGIYAETTLNPDILFKFSLKGEAFFFSVECKWRKDFYQNSIEFATRDQLERYRRYEEKENLPVFIAIGIGGQAVAPNHLYIVPLGQIGSNILNKDFLEEFEKDTEEKFFYDPQTEELR